MASNQPDGETLQQFIRRRLSKEEPLSYSQQTKVKVKNVDIGNLAQCLEEIGNELDGNKELGRLMNELKQPILRSRVTLAAAGALGLTAYFTESRVLAVAAGVLGFLSFSRGRRALLTTAAAMGLRGDHLEFLTRRMHERTSDMGKKAAPRLMELYTELTSLGDRLEKRLREQKDVETDPNEKKALEDVLLNLSEVKSSSEQLLQLTAGQSSASELQDALRQLLHLRTKLQDVLERHRGRWV